MAKEVTVGRFRVLEAMNAEPEMKDVPNAVVFPLEGEIVFKNMSCGNNPCIPVLTDI